MTDTATSREMGTVPPQRVRVAGLEISDITWEDLAEDLYASVRGPVIPLQRRESPRVYLAAHVNSLNHATDDGFRSIMNRATVTYADGISVVLLGRLAGARRMVRLPTTDIGFDMIDAVAQGLGRPARVAIVGGRPGLAERAGDVLAGRIGCQIVYTTHGFHSGYEDVLDELKVSDADVLLVGMGMPLEAHWVDRHLDRLHMPVVITCGGWLGFLAGNEHRAPVLAQRTGLEWVWRLAQDPRRLAGRYVRGAAVTARAAAAIVAARIRGTD